MYIKLLNKGDHDTYEDRSSLISWVFFKYKVQSIHMELHLLILLLGVVGACSWALGPIVSGIVVSKAKATTPFKAMKMICSLMVLVVGGYFVLLFIGCPADKWAGDIKR